MSITVKDLFQYNPNFDKAKLEYLTGKKNYTKKDIINLSRVVSMNDKDLSVFVAEKEGKSFVNSITDDNMRTQVADASNIKNDKVNKNKENTNMPQYIPMDKSVFDIQRLRC